MSAHTLSRIFLGWAALAAVQVVVGTVSPVNAPAPPHALAWLLLTDFLIAGTMGFVASKSDSAGWTLACGMAVIPLCIAIANIIEGSVFLKNALIPWPSLLLHNVLVYALVAPFWRYVFGTRPLSATRRAWIFPTAGNAIWKFAVSDFLYIALYVAAGVIIFPFVSDFYATQTLPSGGKIIALQMLVRGPVFIGVCLLLTRLIDLPRLKAAIVTGLAFALLSGVAPLLMPNPFFPDTVRWVHMAEVTCSNFLFGAGVKLLWSNKTEVMFPAEIRHAA